MTVEPYPGEDLVLDDASLTPGNAGRFSSMRGRFRPRSSATMDDEAETSEAEDAPATDDDVSLAARFLRNVVRLKAVQIDRAQFLRAELRKAGVSDTMIEAAIDARPGAAGIESGVLDSIARATIEFETRKSSAFSFAMGLPGGFGVAATVPADLSQYYVHAFRIM